MVDVFLKPILWLIVIFMCNLKGYYLNLFNLSVFFPDYLSIVARGQIRLDLHLGSGPLSPDARRPFEQALCAAYRIMGAPWPY